MALSKSQKTRKKMERDGKLNPNAFRGSWNGVDPITKVKQNKKKEILAKVAGY